MKGDLDNGGEQPTHCEREREREREEKYRRISFFIVWRRRRRSGHVKGPSYLKIPGYQSRPEIPLKATGYESVMRV